MSRGAIPSPEAVHDGFAWELRRTRRAQALRATNNRGSNISGSDHYNRTPMRAFRRSVFAWIALLGILFTQFAVAAYACPSLPHTTSEQTQAASDSHGLPCPEMATQSHGAFEAQPPDLCNQHCAHDGQTSESRSVAPIHQTFVLAFVLPEPDPSELAGVRHAQQPELLRPTTPPPLWRTGRLRI